MTPVDHEKKGCLSWPLEVRSKSKTRLLHRSEFAWYVKIIKCNWFLDVMGQLHHELKQSYLYVYMGPQASWKMKLGHDLFLVAHESGGKKNHKQDNASSTKTVEDFLWRISYIDHIPNNPPFIGNPLISPNSSWRLVTILGPGREFFHGKVGRTKFLQTSPTPKRGWKIHRLPRGGSMEMPQEITIQNFSIKFDLPKNFGPI